MPRAYNRGYTGKMQTLRASLLRLRLFSAGSSKRAHQAIVSFMARIFEKRSLSRCHGNLRGPWPGKGLGIVHREFVQQTAGPRARKFFDQMQVFAGPAKPGAVREIRGVDNKR